MTSRRNSHKRRFTAFNHCVVFFVISNFLLVKTPHSIEYNNETFGMRAAQYFYHSQEEDSKERIDASVKRGVDLLKKKGKTVTASSIKLLRDISTNREYQFIIDHIFCIEKAEKNTTDKQYNKEYITKCIDKRLSNSTEMNIFAVNYFPLDAMNFTLCAAKTRLIDIEIRYPPYRFMVEGTDEPPEAYDATELLHCVRSRL